ncbi:hypothetical protein [Tsuneonella sp. HG222]
MSAHTPGPWLLGQGGGDGATLAAYTTNEEGRAGAIVANCGGFRFVVRGYEECRANARLIAASPTLYEYARKRAAAGDDEAQQIVEAIHASR